MHPVLQWHFRCYSGRGFVATRDHFELSSDNSVGRRRRKKAIYITFLCSFHCRQDTRRMCSAVLGNGSVATWGDVGHGGHSSAVQRRLGKAQHIQASTFASVELSGDRRPFWLCRRWQRRQRAARKVQHVKECVAPLSFVGCICCGAGGWFCCDLRRFRPCWG